MAPNRESIEINQMHSLPVPEEVKTDVAIAARRREEKDSRSAFKKNRRMNYLIFIASIVAFVVLLGLLVTVFSKGERETKAEAIEIQEGRSDDVDPIAWSKVVELLRTYTPSQKLAIYGTPQNLAATWLTREVMVEGIDSIPEDREYDTAFWFVQRYVLATFYYALGGDHWTHKLKFLSTSNVCEWNKPGQTDVVPATFMAVDKRESLDSITLGIQCNANGEVTSLYIPNNGLKGTIPAETGLLEAMETFAVYRNSISGPLPNSLQYFNDLKQFLVEYNELTGPIPGYIKEWIWLEAATFSHNKFSGSLPDFSSQQRLQALAINDNQLTGSLDVFNQCPELTVLMTQNNNLNGVLSDTTLAESNIRILDASNNLMTGQFYSHFYSFELFDVHNNKVGGSLPKVDAGDYEIQFLSVYGNNMVGPIPSNIGKLQWLTHVDLSANGFTGSIPASFNDLTDLEYLYLGDNKFDSQDFPYLADCTELKELSLRNCNIAAPIPHTIGNHLLKLVLLDLSNNQLIDAIPESLTRAESLRFLLLGNNALTGSVPDDMWDLRNLNMLRVDHNPDLVGSIGAVCNDDGPSDLSHVLADCSLTCECCQTCCQPNDSACGNDIVSPNFDGVYGRTSFVFGKDLDFDLDGNTNGN